MLWTTMYGVGLDLGGAAANASTGSGISSVIKATPHLLQCLKVLEASTGATS
jgi:hypothetical protein